MEQIKTNIQKVEQLFEQISRIGQIFEQNNVAHIFACVGRTLTGTVAVVDPLKSDFAIFEPFRLHVVQGQENLYIYFLDVCLLLFLINNTYLN